MLARFMSAKVVVLCGVMLVALASTGCATDPLVSAMTKVGLGQMDTLTGTEIMAVVTKFSPTTTLTEEQASDLAEFLGEYEIQTLEDFQPVLKVVSGQIDELTTTEILTVGDKFAPDADLTTDQAEAIVEFLGDNSVQTIEDLQDLIEQAQDDPDSVDLPEGFDELFENFDTSMLPDSFLA